MDITADVELVFTGTDDELTKQPVLAVRNGADVRWRIGYGGQRELRVRLPVDHVGAVKKTMTRVVPSNLLPGA